MIINKWTLNIECSFLDDQSLDYIRGLPDFIPSVEWVWAEMDRVWDSFSLDNKIPISDQDVGKFYSHPVWIMNGLFTEIDPESKKHRMAIASYLNDKELHSVADYGGGSGVLARVVCEAIEEASVDIIEPFAFDLFKNRNNDISSVTYVSGFRKKYDAAIAQDVLEHVDDPVNVAFEIAGNVRDGGYVVFANCFYPVIKCHLPSTFYMRYSFKWVMRIMGLQFVERIPGAEHALVFRKNGDLKLMKSLRASELIRPVGEMLNKAGPILSKIKKSVL